MPLNNKTTKIEITYSNAETQKLGVKIGDQFEATREYYLKTKTIDVNGILIKKRIKVLKQQCWFQVDGVDCVAYKCQHDDDAILYVTTCKLVKE